MTHRPVVRCRLNHLLVKVDALDSYHNALQSDSKPLVKREDRITVDRHGLRLHAKPLLEC